MTRPYPVRIDAKTYSADFQNPSSPAWKSVLKHAYGGTGQVQCCCPGRGERRLAVKHYDGSDSFGLARYPETGEEHALDCRFYAPNAQKSGLQGYSVGVVEERNDGTLGIRLGIGLRRKDPAESPVEPPPVDKTNRSPGKQQAAMSLLGLLHLLWNESGLNRWWPSMAGKRHAALIGYLMDSTAKNIRVSRGSLADSLLVCATRADSDVAQRNAAKVSKALQNKGRLLVVAPLANWSEETEKGMEKRLALFSAYGTPLVFMQEGEWGRAVKKFPLAISGWKAGRRVVAIAQIEPWEGRDGKAKSTAVGIGLMQVSDNWIPVESGYEFELSALLEEQGRAFTKPLRFDAGTDQVFPDFVLHDTESREFPMEVFGRTDEAYEARKAEKQAYYKQNYGIDGWWSWNAASGQPIPALPARKVPQKAAQAATA